MSEPISARKDIIMFDLDGTIALVDHRRHLVEGKKKDFDAFYAACGDDTPNLPVTAVWRALFVSGFPWEMWIVSGRSETTREITEAWLVANGVPKWHNLIMRPAGDSTPDHILKREMIRGYEHRIAFCFDDRTRVVNMWRELGITCFQVAPGDF